MQKLAQILSNIFQPIFIPTYCILLLFQVDSYEYFNIYYKLYTIVTIFVLTTLIPLSAILILKKIGYISNIQLTERKDRIIPYIVAIVSYITAIAFLWRIYMPKYIVTMMIGTLLATVFVTIVNTKWKISAHLCAMGSMCAAILVVALRVNINPVFLLSTAFILSGLVASARMVLSIHTPMQTLAGFFTGFIFILAFGSFNFL